jgi:predicted HTH transcriptional regulator
MAEACDKLGIKLQFISEPAFFMVRFVKLERKIPLSIEQKLNDRQRKGFEYVGKHGQITNRDYQKLCGISRRQGLKDLSELVEKGLLNKEGEGRSVRYVLSQKNSVPD